MNAVILDLFEHLTTDPCLQIRTFTSCLSLIVIFIPSFEALFFLANRSIHPRQRHHFRFSL